MKTDGTLFAEVTIVAYKILKPNFEKGYHIAKLNSLNGI